MITGTKFQERLVEYKKKYCANLCPEIGIGYWQGFTKRNKEKIVSVVGKKYELSRDKWTTYSNFRQMYEHIIDELVHAKIAVKLDEPEWQDDKGKKVEEDKAIGCRVTHRILRPDYCVVGDKTGGIFR